MNKIAQYLKLFPDTIHSVMVEEVYGDLFGQNRG